MAFDVELRDPGTGFDIALAAAAGGGADSYLVPTPFYSAPTALDDDDLVALTLLLA